jgi:hypothetical protein
VSASALLAGPALASRTQITIFEPGSALNADPVGTLHTLRLLGVRYIRLVLHWSGVAPDSTARTPPRHFNGADPSSYRAAAWAMWDRVIRTAAADGITVDLDVAGRAPSWAMPRSAPLYGQGSVYPSAADYRAFMTAVGRRYSGTYTPPGALTPLPRIDFWSIWNEPNYVSSLEPQGSGPHDVTPVSPRLYRGLVAAAWTALNATGHRSDTILIGELAPRGYPNDGHGYMYPILFVRALYCVGANYRPLRGVSAFAQGCPTTAAASRHFPASNPGLFDATGFADHPYSRNGPPNTEVFSGCATKLCASLADLPYLIAALDGAQRAYRSSTRFPIYSTEYGYQTSPPKHGPGGAPFLSLQTAAQYINWAEYFSYSNPRVASYDQFLLDDPERPDAANNFGDGSNYASGIETWNGHPKPGFGAFRLPIFIPQTTATSSGQSLAVWGCARPEYYAALDTGNAPQTVDIQLRPTGASRFTTIDVATITSPAGYFEVGTPFARSGTVRLKYTYPATDPLLAPGETVFSREVSVTVR